MSQSGRRRADAGSIATDAGSGDRKPFDRFMDFVRGQGVERTADDPFVHERIADTWEDVPQEVRDYEPGGWWNEATNADDLGNHYTNQRLPGGYHITTEKAGGSVSVHLDAHDPTVSPGSFWRHMNEIQNAPQPSIHRNRFPDWSQ